MNISETFHLLRKVPETQLFPGTPDETLGSIIGRNFTEVHDVHARLRKFQLANLNLDQSIWVSYFLKYYFAFFDDDGREEARQSG